MQVKPVLRKSAELGVGLTVIATLILAGCGSSSSTNANPPGGGGTLPVAAVRIAGTGAKGIIKFAVVTAFELDSSGKTLRTVGTSETDSSGKYSLNTNSSYTGGPLKLELTAKGDGSTKMVCDVAAGCGAGVAFGQDYSLSSTFKLGAYQQGNSSGNAVTTQITPYSNMVVARVEAQVKAGSALDNNLVAGAVSQVSQIVGVDISTTEPVDITSASAVAAASANALQYAAFNAGIGALAFANAGGFDAGIAAAASSFADGKFDSTDPVKIADITAAVNTEAQATTGLDTTMLTATLASIAANTTNGNFTPTAPSTTTLTAVAQAKDLVSQTRTWGTQISALNTPAKAFSVDMDTARAVLNSNSAALTGVLGQVLGQALHEVKIQSETGLLAQTYPFSISYTTVVNGLPAVQTGTGSVTVVDNGTTLDMNIASTNLAGVTASGKITTSISHAVLNTPTTSLDVAGATLNFTGGASLVSDATTSITLDKATFTAALTAGKTSATAVQTDLALAGLDGALTMKASGATFVGTGKIVMVGNGNTQVNAAHSLTGLSLSEISLNGTFTGSSGSATASASIKFNNAATFDTLAYLTHQPVVYVNKFMPGDPFGVVALYSTAVSGADTLSNANYDSFTNMSYAGGVSGNPAYTLLGSGDPFGVGDKVKADISATYHYPQPTITNVSANYDINWGSWYSATLIYPDFETASNFATATITVSTGVTLPNNPAATLTVTANRTGWSAGNPTLGDMDAVLAFNGQTVNMYISNSGKYPVTTDCAIASTVTIGSGGTPATTATPANTLVISNPNGVKLVFNGGTNNGTSNTGLVCVGSTKVGTINTSGSIPLINYTDGTFESLN